MPEQGKSVQENTASTSDGTTNSSVGSPHQPDNRITVAIESLVRFAGAGLLIVYATGFIILAVYESAFGIAQFNPFRTKIIAAGLVFCLLAGLPVLALLLDFSVAQPEDTDKNLPFAEQVLRNNWRGVSQSQFINTSIMLALLSSFLFTRPPGSPGPAALGVLFIIIAIIFQVKSFRVVRDRFSTRPVGAAFLSLFSMAVMVAALYSLDFPIIIGMSVWFFVIGLSASAVRSEKDKIQYLLNWRRWPVALILIAIYANLIYGRIEARYGGGAPVPVTFCLDKPPAWIGFTTFRASLIDETDYGFYVLLSGNDKALFIPRTTVVSLYFDSKEPHYSAK